MVCFRCGLEGHKSEDCENEDLDLIRSWKDSTACAELKERMKVRPAVFATQSPPARSSKLIADTACTPVSITATARLVANRRLIEGTFTTAAGPGKIIATGTLNVLQPALAVLPVAQVESPPGCTPSPSLLSIPSFLNSDPTASAVAPAAPKGEHELHLANATGRVATFRENERGLFEIVEAAAPSDTHVENTLAYGLLAHVFEENAHAFCSDTDVQSASAYFSSLPEYNPTLHESELLLTEPATYQLSATFKERYADYLKLHHDCLHASDERLRSVIDNKLVAGLY